MSNVQIPNLPAVASVSGAELMEAVQAGSSVKVTINQISQAAVNTVAPYADAAASSATAASNSATASANSASASATSATTSSNFAENSAGSATASATSAAAAAISAQQAAANSSPTYYVDPAGSDTNDGITPATAYATVTKAASSVQSGGRVRLKCGSTFREMPDFSTKTGITISNYFSGKRPIISGKDVVTTFTAYSGGPAYTFNITLPDGTGGNRNYPGVFENDVRMVEVAVSPSGDFSGHTETTAALAIAYVQATPGTFYFAGPGTYAAGWTAGVKTYYIHPADNSNPNTNGKVYTAYARQYSVKPGANVLDGLNLDAGFGHDGLDGYGTALKNCSITNFPRHGSLFDVGTLENIQVFGSNGVYKGSLYETNPPAHSLTKQSSIINCNLVGADSYASVGFFCHISSATDELLDGVTILNCSATNAMTLLTFTATKFCNVINLKGRNFNSITSGITNLYGTTSYMNLINCDIRGGEGLSSTRPIQVIDNSEMNISGGFYDNNANYFLKQTATTDAGKLTISDATIILRTVTSTSGSAFFSTESSSGTSGKKIKGLDLRRVTLYSANGNGQYLALTKSIDSLYVDDLYVLGLTETVATIPDCPQRDPILRLDGVSVRLSSVLPNARVIWIDPSRAIAVDDGNAFSFNEGAYQHGMKIFSGIAYSSDTAQQPRSYVAVGDQIVCVTPSENVKADIRVASPAYHLNSVCYSKAATTGTNSTCIAVGNSGLIYSSADSTTFTVRTNPGTDNLNAVAASNMTVGVIVAVGDNGAIVRSTDNGTTWTSVTSGTTAKLNAVATNVGTTWIAAGAGGVVGTSVDGGVTWTWGTVGTADHYSMIWHTGLSLFFLGSDGGAIRTSPATISWTSRTTNTINRVKSIAQGPDGVIAGLYQTSPNPGSTIIASPDGITWTPNGTVLPFEVRAVAGVGGSTYNGKAYAAVGESSYMATAQYRTDAFAVRPMVPVSVPATNNALSNAMLQVY